MSGDPRPKSSAASVRFWGGYLSAGGAAIAMSTLVLFVRQVSVAAETIVLFRLGGGALLFLAVLASLRRTARVKAQVTLPLVASSLVFPLVVLSCVNAMRLTSAANAAFVLYLGPALATLLAWPLLKERPSRRNVCLVLVALAGIGLLVGFDRPATPSNPAWIPWALASALFYATYLLANRSIPPQTSTEARTIWQLGLGAGVALVLLAVDSLRGNLPSLPVADIPWLATIGLVNGALALMLMTQSLRVLRTSEYAVMAYIEPVSSALLGWALLGEGLSVVQVAGGVMVVAAGVLQAASGEGPRPRQPSSSVPEPC